MNRAALNEIKVYVRCLKDGEELGGIVEDTVELITQQIEDIRTKDSCVKDLIKYLNNALGYGAKERYSKMIDYLENAYSVFYDLVEPTEYNYTGEFEYIEEELRFLQNCVGECIKYIERYKL